GWRGVGPNIARWFAGSRLGSGDTWMARIAVAGFQHETNSFVAETTDFATFASHRDRPPLVRGEEVLRWLGETSFALSGFLHDMRAGHTILPLLWTSGGAGGAGAGAAPERLARGAGARLSAARPGHALDVHPPAASV